MDMNLLREIVTVVSFAAFVAILAYVAYPGNRRHFDEAAQLPFDEDETLTPTLSQGRGREP